MPGIILMICNVTNKEECSKTFLAIVDNVKLRKLYHDRLYLVRCLLNWLKFFFPFSMIITMTSAIKATTDVLCLKTLKT